MRKLVELWLIMLFTSICVPASAHAGDEALGHHWHVAKYTAELRLQTIVMIVFIVGVVLVVAARRALARRNKKI